MGSKEAGLTVKPQQRTEGTNHVLFIMLGKRTQTGQSFAAPAEKSCRRESKPAALERRGFTMVEWGGFFLNN